MRPPTSDLSPIALLLLATTLGCATGAPPLASAHPAPIVVSGLPATLEPDASAVRASHTIGLTGDEAGRMWTLDNLPLARWSTGYGFEPDADWIERIRAASLRFGEYCSAAFVSDEGLAVTNQHCARECVEAVSSSRTDHVVEGFTAASRRQERECPGLFVDQLVSIEDVTAGVERAGAGRGPGASAVERALKEAAVAIEAECEERFEGSHCQVVPQYGGARWVLHRYRRFSPVKLVFAPELQAAYFGGEHDNFTYPRYALDIAFVRVYEGDSPVEPAAYFEIDPDGAEEGETVFAVGNPGSTSRHMTVAQLMYERAYRLPLRLWLLNNQKNLLSAAMAANEDLESELRQDAFEVSNSLKAHGGMLDGLRDSLVVAAKIRQERELRAKVAADPALEAEYGDVWFRLAEIQQRKLDISPRLNASNLALAGSPHLELANTLTYYIRQTRLPETARNPRYRGDRGEQLRYMLETETPIDPTMAWLTLSAHLSFMERWVPPGEPLRDLLLQPGETVEAAAKRLIDETRILDPAFRRALLDGGIQAIESADDPLVVYARLALADAESLWQTWDEVLAEEAAQKRRLGRVLLAIHGDRIPPDATFTLRVSDGIMKRYAVNGTFAPAATTYYGLFARAAEFGGEEPWALPPAFEKARTRIDMKTALDFVATTDITGGSSGSAVIDTDGRLVGIVFDSNIELLPNDYLYGSAGGRTVAVHSAGILEALRHVYEARSLVAELTDRNRGR
jgi:hypothetical protein